MYANINPSIDVRLLRTTYLLLRERNVSKVAVLLGHSQPAVSACLKKARRYFRIRFSCAAARNWC